ncbi:MAG TPA: hypothetical protein PLD73_13170 [Candidatus Hydrogenedentes bacterium]|jgi:hypothetical protein|nr:hypothetical protein [Candidatus Hydrogenedentota bacterium]
MSANICSSRASNVITVETEGRSGLLYGIMCAMAQLNLTSSIARLATSAPWTCGSRHVAQNNGKTLKPAPQAEIRKEIHTAIHP